MERSRQIGKVGEIFIEVKSAAKPWAEGLGDGVVVLPCGIRGSMRGAFASFWREGLKDGREVITQISERIQRIRQVEPERPAWMVIQLEIDGESRHCNLCVATAFDQNGIHLDNPKLAILAVMVEATRRNFRRMAVPLLGAGGGGLLPELVVRRQIEAVIAHTQREGDGLEKITLLVRDQDFEKTVKVATTFMSVTSGAEKWYEAIKKRGKFRDIRVVEELPGGYSGARLDVCEVIDEHGVHQPLTVFKIASRTVVKKEATAAKAARDLLGEYVVGASDTYFLRGESAALRMPLAGTDHSGRPAMSYLRFFKESGDPHEVARALTQLFGAMRPMYESGGRRSTKLRELREGMERRRNGLYWIEAASGYKSLLRAINNPSRLGGVRVILGYPVDATIDDPFHEDAPLTKGWDRRIEAPMAKMTHGDLNPRNVVMIKTTGDSFAPRILDFDRFGEAGPLATDFARFEAGVHIKCLERQIRDRGIESARKLRRYEEWVSSRFLTLVDGSLIHRVAPEFTKAVFAVNSIRNCYEAISRLDDRRSYWMCLVLSLLSYLRPVYDARLSNEQRLFAVFMAANILDRHVLREP